MYGWIPGTRETGLSSRVRCVSNHRARGLLKTQPLPFRVRIYIFLSWWISRSPADDLMRALRDEEGFSTSRHRDAKNNPPGSRTECGGGRGSGPTYNIVSVSWMGRFSPGKRSGDRPEREWGSPSTLQAIIRPRQLQQLWLTNEEEPSEIDPTIPPPPVSTLPACCKLQAVTYVYVSARLMSTNCCSVVCRWVGS